MPHGSQRNIVERNIVSGNGNGIFVLGDGTDDSIIRSNLIGTDISGLLRLGNDVGIRVLHRPDSTTVSGNTVSANAGRGIDVLSATGTIIRKNKVGTSRAGTRRAAGAPDLGNTGDGVVVTDSTVTITDNLVSGNGNNGIVVVDAVGGTINNNKVGTDLAGSDAIPNLNSGIVIARSTGVRVDGNLISGNDKVGLSLSGTGTTAVVASNNKIGTTNNGRSGLPNGWRGVDVGSGAQENVLQANVIAFNNKQRVLVFGTDSDRNAIIENLVFDNCNDDPCTGGIQLNPETAGALTTVSQHPCLIQSQRWVAATT